MKKLEAEGYEITSTTNKGYKLLSVPDKVTSTEIKYNLNTVSFGQDIVFKEVVDSTNTLAKQLARDGVAEGTIVVAEEQIAGKGRQGKVWSAPKGTGIWMSIVLRPKLEPQYASQLTLLAGLSMCTAIRDVTGLEAMIKWPNDLVLNNKKITGILTEMSAEIEGINYVVIGIGVNVNIMEFDEDLTHATSLALEGGKKYKRSKLIRRFLEIFEYDYNNYIDDGNLSRVLDRYKRYCVSLDKEVKIIKGGNERIAYATDITPGGALKVTYIDTNETEDIIAGEVSVRGIYGYV